jgi:RecB family exonuclease
MMQWEGLASKVVALPGEKLTEYKMAIDEDLNPAPWGSAWSRGIADVVVVNKTKAATLDYKTGKVRPSDQLELYAMYVMAHFPKVDECSTAFVWLKEKKTTKATVYRDEVPKIKKKFSIQVAKLQSSYERNAWPAKPSGLCEKYCPVKDCEFNGKKRYR